jgi:hypothetical protein
MQAVPEATGNEIIDALHKNGDRFNLPDSLYGYGIPNMAGVLNMLQDKYIPIPEKEITVGPNPFRGEIEITFKDIPETLRLLIFTSSGQIEVDRNYRTYIGRTLKVSDLQNKQQGIYFISLITSKKSYTYKVIKLNN